MGADVADAAGGAAAPRIRPPNGLLLSRGLEARAEPALGIFDHHLAHGAQPAGPHELAGLLHHGIAGVVMGEHEDLSRPPHDGAQAPGLGEAEGDRLVADDIEAGFEEAPGDRKVLVVGRDDDDEVEAPVGRAAAPRPGPSRRSVP